MSPPVQDSVHDFCWTPILLLDADPVPAGIGGADGSVSCTMPGIEDFTGRTVEAGAVSGEADRVRAAAESGYLACEGCELAGGDEFRQLGGEPGAALQCQPARCLWDTCLALGSRAPTRRLWTRPGADAPGRAYVGIPIAESRLLPIDGKGLLQDFGRPLPLLRDGFPRNALADLSRPLIAEGPP